VSTENVAILFTDIVRSTELSQRVSQETADEVRRGHFSVLRQAVAKSGGSEVKNVGDGVMVVFTSASAALDCAVAMQQGVERQNHSSGHSVGLRVGISVGDAISEEGDYFGDPVIEAVRLCAECESGQVLASDLVRALAGRRSRHECRSVGELTLRGLAAPVEAVEVLWESLGSMDAGTSVPLPRRLAARPFAGVVGRETDLASISDAFKRVAAGGGREVILISGEAGLGKTTLAAEAARSVIDSGACVLFGHCEEDVAAPYQLFGEALGHYVAHAPEDPLRAHLESHGSELARLVPALASRIPDLPESRVTDSDSERYLLFASAVGLLSQISSEQPVVLVLDDLQWADRGSLQLLNHVASFQLPMRVLVLATYRDSELSHASALVEALGSLRRQIGVSRIDLTGLDDSGVITLMEAASGQTLVDAEVSLAHAIHRETDGNPFFVIEVLRHLTETGAIVQDDTGRWVPSELLHEGSLPDGVREVIGARVVRLGKRAEEILSVASVVGRDFDFDLVVAAAKATDDEVLEILDASAAAALVRELDAPPGRYSFAHSLIQRTIYEDLGPTRQARAHRRVAEALEDLCGGRPGSRVGELARHWFSATQTQDLDKALTYSRQAADAALASLAPEDALHYYLQALDLLAQIRDPDPAVEMDLKIGVGTTQRQVGDPAFARTLLDVGRLAADRGDTDRLVRALTANDRGLVSSVTSVNTDKVELLERALEQLPDGHPDRALLLATLCSENAFDTPLEERMALADLACSAAEAGGNDATIVRVLNQVALPCRAPQYLELSLSRSEDALARAQRIGDPLLLFVAAVARVPIAINAGDLEEVDRCLSISETLAQQLGQPTFAWGHNFLSSTRAQIAGEVDHAEQFANMALQIGNESGEADALLLFGTQFMLVHWQRGTVGNLIPLIEQAVADNPGVPGLPAGLAVAHAEQDMHHAARRLLERSLESFEAVPDSGAWLTETTMFAEVAVECRVPEAAKLLLDALSPWANQFSCSGITAEGPVSHYLGGLSSVLGRYDEAERFFSHADESNVRMGAAYFAARTDLWRGRMLADRLGPGDLDRARDLLTRARSAAAANGYGGVERRATAALESGDDALRPEGFDTV
jgi:class 3 adenylate cyclase/tetratricopeptide (TPR) repeat protein